MGKSRSEMLVVLGFALIMALTPAAYSQTIWYVDDSSVDGLNDGSDWENAFVELQSALAVSVSGDEIRVAQGRYTPDYDVPTGVHTGDRTASFVLVDGVALYGGYAGLDEADPSFRNVNDYVTVLSGDLGGDDRGGLTERYDNSYHVVYARSVDSGSVLDGFTITGGNADGDDEYETGGGIYCQWSNLQVRHCTIRGNKAAHGGGMYITRLKPVLDNCKFINNWAAGYGGGLHIDNSGPLVTNCIFRNNMAHAYNCGGGGIYWAYVGSANLLNCAFIENISTSVGGGIYFREDGDLTVTGCTFNRNKSTSAGGGLCNLSGIVTLNNCVFWENAAKGESDEEGQIYTYRDNVTAKNCCIMGLSWYVGNGNIDDDPRLTRDGIHLQGNSPCINAGNPNNDYSVQIDIDGESRLAGLHADIGCDEYIDTDSDLMPDWWEERYWGANTAGAPDSNPDSDTHTNLGEYIADTNPLQGPLGYYVSLTGNDDWDGLSSEWDGVHGPKRTIQAGIEVTARYEGDIVTVLPGIYRGSGNRDLDFNGKEVTVEGSGQPDSTGAIQTVIDCEGSEEEPRRGVWFRRAESSKSVLSRLEIRNGYSADGGGVSCILSSPTLRNCVFRNNRAEYGGGVHNHSYADPVVERCIFRGNYAEKSGWRRVQ